MPSIRRDLGFQLLALYLMFIGPVILASWVFDQLITQRLEADVKAADLALARAIAQETNTILETAMIAVSQLAQYPAVVQSDPADMEVLFSVVASARPDVNLVYRLDENGRMAYHFPPGPGSTVGWDFSGRDYYQRALTSHEPLLSEGRISPTTGQPVATAVMPLWSKSGEFLGLVATNIKLQSLNTTLASIAAEHHTGEDFEVAILDASGQVIAHPDPASILVDMRSLLPQVSDAVLSGRSGNLVTEDNQGVEKLYSYVPIPSAGWGVIVSRSTAEAFATLSATHRGVIFTVGVFLVVGLFFWLALDHRVIRPLEKLSDYSQTIGGSGKHSDQQQALATLAQRPDQLGHLASSLERMDQAIHARLSELSTLLETSAAVVSSLDSQIVLNRILEQVERLMGIQMCAIVALDEKTGVFRARASRGLSSRYAEQLSIDPSEPYSVTLRAIRSGEPIQVSDTEEDASFAASRPRARSEGYRSILAVPLTTLHAPPAALLVYRADPHTFSPSEISLITSFANHAAMAIENASLFERSDLRLQEQSRRLEALIQSLQDGLILEDLQGCVLYANHRIEELVGLTKEEISDFSIARLIERLMVQSIEETEEQRQKTRHKFEDAMTGRGDQRFEINLNADHQTRTLRMQVFEVTDSDKMPIGRGLIVRDVTRNRELDRMKSSLVSTVSHELRTPLAAIKGYATTLLAEDVQWDSQAQREFLEIISKETDRLSNLVSDLLDISRIEAGNLSVTRQECNLEELVTHAAKRAHPTPGERLQVAIPAEMPELNADPQRIEAVLRNLLENAAKYSNDNSPIRVSASIQGDHVVVRVQDEGPGIPPESSQRIFESFYRLENGLTRRAPGAGLGLAICQGFVHAHGGEIWLEPSIKGTCIAFSLPLNDQQSKTGQ
jgi:PAS domain S-box-containing protein